MATLKVEFGKKRNDGRRKTYIVVSQHGKRKRFDTLIDIWPDELTKNKKGEWKLPPSKQRLLDKAVERCRETIYDVERANSGRHIDVELLMDHITGKRGRDGELDFFRFADDYLKTSTIKGKKNYLTMLNSLEKHLGRRRLPFSEITYKMLSDYSRSLSDRPRAQSLYLGAIRHLHREARLQYNTDTETPISPTIFERFKVPKQRMKGQRAISIEQFLRIFNYEGKGLAGMARDCFVLSFLLMGMNSADMYDTDAKLMDGCIAYRRKKTRDRRADEAYLEVTVPSEAEGLLAKYKGKGSLFSFRQRYSTEGEFNRSINKGLKQVGEVVGINKLQFYQARHTWASVARNECGIDAYTIEKALNHIVRDAQLLDVYVKRDFGLVNEANRKVLDWVLYNKR